MYRRSYHARRHQPGEPLELLRLLRMEANLRTVRPGVITSTGFFGSLNHDFPDLLTLMDRRLERRRATGRADAEARWVWVLGTSGVTVDMSDSGQYDSARVRTVLDPALPYGYAELYRYELDAPDGGHEEASRRRHEDRHAFTEAKRWRQRAEGERLRQPERRA